MTSNPFDNQDFRREFEETLDKKLNPLILKVEEHERVINKSRGVLAVLATFWSLVLAGIEYLIHRH